MTTPVAPMVASSSSAEPTSPPSPPPESLLLDMLTHTKKGEQIPEEIQPSTAMENDYGIWDPAPYSGGNYASPIPHGEVG